MICPNCGIQNVEQAQVCVSCGQVLPSARSSGAPVPVKISGLAIAAFVLGILSIFTVGLTALLAIVLGIIAVVIIEKSGGRLTGTAFAIIGIVLAVLSFFVLMGTVMLALSRARAQGMRAACLNNMKQLSLGWLMYADENDDKIVNGMAGSDRTMHGTGVEKPWVGRDWAAGYKTGERLPELEQESAIMSGLLFPYFEAKEPYRCPAGWTGQARTYAIVDSMNGTPRPGTFDNNVGVRVGRGGRGVLWIKKRTEILNPASRIVFIDQGWAAPESFPVHYQKAQWWCAPPLTHEGRTNVSFADGHVADRQAHQRRLGGTNTSFADGHVEFRPWRAAETHRIASRPDAGYGGEQIVPATPDGEDDLHDFQRAVWGRLGYAPTSSTLQ